MPDPSVLSRTEPEILAILDKQLGLLPLAHAPYELRLGFAQWARQSGLRTVRDLILHAERVPATLRRVRDMHLATIDALIDALRLPSAPESALPLPLSAPTAPADPAVLRDRMTPEEVDAWAALQGLLGLTVLVGQSPRELSQRFTMPTAGVDVALRLGFDGTSWARNATNALVKQLGALAVRRQELLALTPPDDPVLGPLIARLRARRLALIGYVDEPVHIDIEDDPPIARVHNVASWSGLRYLLHEGRWLSSCPPKLEAGFCDEMLELLERVAPGDGLYELLRRPQWERDLLMVRAALAGPPPPDGARRELGWRLSTELLPWARPVLCRRTRTGSWDAALVQEVPPSLRLDPVDDELATLVEPFRTDAPAAIRFRALELMIGHPRVMIERRAVSVSRATMTLAMCPQEGGALALVAELEGRPVELQRLRQLAAESRGAPGVVMVEGDRVLVVRLDSHRLALLEHAAHRLSQVPPEAFPALVKDFEGWGARAGVVLPVALAGEPVAGDARPLLRLSADGGALNIEARIRPLPEAVPQLPGEGPSAVYAQRGERRIFATRDLMSEPALVREALPWLRDREPSATWGWTLRLERPAELELALELVDALQAAPDRLQVEWSGELLRTTRPVQRARIVLKSERDWLGVSGELDGLRTADLLAAITEGAAFVEVSRGTWARITDTLREAVAPLARITALEEEPRITGLQASLLAALPAEVEVQGSSGLLRRLDDVRAAAAAEPPVPAGLQASLRPYQAEGWRWLARLAMWAPGAVLADDMGLGKTVQAIALLLDRAARGPALVIAPTSVVPNWASELARFAPSLAVTVYHGAARELPAPGPGQVLLTTWGLAQRDAALKDVRFATLILDEAQAIKNPDAQRTAAVSALQADFRLALTGTPVENSALDLWSILRVTTPGLLPGREVFRTRWLTPIEGRDPAARRALAAATRPFVLRRTKGAVAQELPEKTEINVPIPLSEDERVLYERARLRAVEQLGGTTERFAVLAALTRLRQLACHPRLVDAASPVGSSKLHTLVRMLADLRSSGQRALVFSQFVELLDLVAPAVAAAGLTALRLDGATSLEARRSRVASFQAGEADVFLISLKAGGAGLNLTAATYVFHLDPWWNPAAEDQATDRAHRIGQDQPVTVYRLVSTDTIEDAILGLHADKRTLASDLLSGTESARPLAVSELLALLGGRGP